MDPAHPVRPKVHNIVGGGDDEWAAVEMTNTSQTLTGMEYNNTFCWVTRWNTEGKIVQVSNDTICSREASQSYYTRLTPWAPLLPSCRIQVRAYLDTALVDSIVHGSEGKI